MDEKWFVIINPTSGNGAAKKKWIPIYNELIKQKFDFDFSLTEYKKHSITLIEKAIKQGITNYGCYWKRSDY